MHTRILRLPHGPEILIRPLRHGDTRTIQTVFGRLGEESRRSRFNGAKTMLRDDELRVLATVGPNHQVLVAWAEGDPEPVATARLVRLGDSAEIAFEVADAYQGRGIGSALTRLLIADALAAGIREITALVRSDNSAALALLRRALGRLELRFEGPDTLVRASLSNPC